MKEQCYSCNRILNIKEMTIDEGDLWWCWDCVERWEQQTNRSWEDGQPLKVPKNLKMTDETHY